MDIGSKNDYPSCALSNFAAHKFEIDGVKCASMEGFLQSLKCPTIDMQKYICSLIGIKAKKAGYGRNWQRRQILYWQGQQIGRSSKAYQDLLDRAYDALYENQGFKAALIACGKDAVFTHSIGKNCQNETVLTAREFCNRLMKLKDRAFKEIKEMK